jgi:hypothetical protein
VAFFALDPDADVASAHQRPEVTKREIGLRARAA